VKLCFCVQAVRPSGELGLVVGTLAKKYQEMGGRVQYVGKPHKHIFQAALDELDAIGISDRDRIAMVGDSLQHDVQGAHNAGVRSVFVPGGVHYKELGLSSGPQAEPGPSDTALATLFDKHQLTPDHVLLRFALCSASV